MTQATHYTRTTGFADDERNNAGGRSTVATADVDFELDAIGDSVNLTIDNVALLQRDDGVMRDGVVPISALGADTLKLLTTGTSTPRGAWVTATTYNAKDLVTQLANTYICVTAHVSGVFATDLAAIKWILFQIGANPTASAVPFSPTLKILSTSVQAALVEIDTNWRSELSNSVVDIASFSSTGRAIYDGVVDCATAINAALAAGSRIQISGPARIKSQIVVPSGKWITMLPGAGIILDTAFFTGARNTATGVGILFNGTAGGGITGGYIKPDVYVDTRKLVAVRFVSASGFRMDGVEMFGFSQANGVISIDSCSDWGVTNCRVHDCTSNSNADTAAQITALTIDDNKVASVVSTDWTVIGNRFHDLTVGATFLAMNGGNNYQTDGMTIEAGTTNGVISGNTIFNVGEGIDCWGANIAITGNSVRHSYIFGIKLVHGASYNSVVGNAIYDSGLAGITVQGSSADTNDTSYNVISGNDIAGIDASGNWSASTTACLLVSDGTGTTFIPRNNLFTGNFLNPGPSGKYCIARSLSTDTSNEFPSTRFVASGSVGYVSDNASGLGRITATNRTLLRAVVNTSQTVNASTAAKVQLNTRTFDDRNEFDATTNFRFACQIPGLYRVYGQITLGTVVGASKIGLLEIRKNGSAICGSHALMTTSASYAIEELVACAVGDYIELWYTNGDTSNVSINNGSVNSYLTVQQA